MAAAFLTAVKNARFYQGEKSFDLSGFCAKISTNECVRSAIKQKIYTGNNPMVGASVAVAVDVNAALNG